MTTPRPPRRSEWRAAWHGLAKGLATMVAAGLGLGLLFFLYFILPKIEAIYRDLGRPLPTPLAWAAISSSYLFKYFWLALISFGLLLILGARGDFPRSADRPRD